MRQARIIFLLASTVLVSSVNIAWAQNENPYLRRQKELARQRFQQAHPEARQAVTLPEAPVYHAPAKIARSVKSTKATTEVYPPQVIKPSVPFRANVPAESKIVAPKITPAPLEVLPQTVTASAKRQVPAEQMQNDAPISEDMYNVGAPKSDGVNYPVPTKNIPTDNANNGGINPAAYKTVAAKPSPRRDNLVRVSTGGRRDNFDWNIASDASGTVTPNILSELKWRKLNIVQIQADAAGAIPKDEDYIGGIYGEASAYTGVILSGDNQDSDYLGNNRTDEFSRSNNDAGKGHVRGFSSGLGYEFDTDSMHSSLPNLHTSIVPLAGYSLQRLYLHMQDGKQTIASADTPPLGEFGGLNSTYRATWKGLFLGVKLNADYFPHNFGLRTQYSFAKYNGVADWNMRADFQHPKSFAQKADGSGTLFQLDYSYALSENAEIFALAGRQAWSADSGNDTIYFADDTIRSSQRLNKVNWNSQNYMMGVAAHW